MAATEDTVSQLNEARKLALGDPKLYAQVVPGVLPLIGPGATIELQRWGSDFLSETFASPVLPSEQKTALALEALSTIKGYLEVQDGDIWVTKAAVQVAASCYPLIFRHIIDHPNDSSVWQTIAAIKSNILRRMDGSQPGIRICCIKFVQSVVQAQTAGVIKDPRRPEQNDISLALVPRDHPIIPPTNLEAEASGLLDRLLSTLQDVPSDALLVTATLNCLGGLVLTRASIANKILQTVMSFNPLVLASSPLTVKARLLIRSLERTARGLLVTVLKLNPKHVLAGRMQQYLEHLHRSREEAFNEASRKRGAPNDDEDAVGAKRQKIAPIPQPVWPPPLAPGPVTIANVFSLTTDPNIRNFDVTTIADINTVVACVIPMLQMASQERVERAINAVRARWLSLTDPSAQTVLNTPQARGIPTDEDDDDYEPDWPMQDAEIANGRLKGSDATAATDIILPNIAGIGPFKLPEPQQLAASEIGEWERGMVARVFGKMTTAKELDKRQPSAGFNRLAGERHDRDAWITLLSRLATRGSVGLGDVQPVKAEPNGTNGTMIHSAQPESVADEIRRSLRDYVVQDFRKRIGVAISWLNEEWYNDRILLDAYESDLSASAGEQGADEAPAEPRKHYEKWLLHMMDGFLPYLDVKDKVLIRFLSEVPEIPESVLLRVKRLADDPERVPLAISSLQYLIILKPPARNAAIDAMAALWRDNPDAKPLAAKVLTKWRPHVLQEEPNGVGAMVVDVKPDTKVEIAA